MSIRFRVENRPESVRFALAPAAEALMSLHVLLFPKTHSVQHPWIRAMRTVSPALKREIRAFAFIYADAFPDCFIPTRSNMSFEDQLDVIRGLDDAEAAHQLARPIFFYWEPAAGGPERLGEPSVRDNALAFARETAGDAGVELAAAAFDDPSGLRDRLVALFERYWEEAFAPEWARIEPRLQAALVESAERAISEGPLAVLGDIPGVRLHGDTLVRLSGHDHEVEISPANPLLLVPSAYVWPHARVNCDPPWPLVVNYAAPFVVREATRDELPAVLVQTLRAVGDETRLRILKLVAERPRPTEELAPLVNLSEPALSRQLRILSEAGLVRPQRNGYYVLYALEREALETLPATLGAFLSESGKTE